MFFITTVVLFFQVFISCGKHNNRTVIDGSPNGTPAIEFSNYEHDFGKIVAGEKVAAIFKFTNTGEGPLVIKDVIASCGCTAPRYNTKPVLPGEKGTIEIVFDSGGFNGIQRKTVTVRSNASQPAVVLQVKAEIIQKKSNK